MNEIIIKKTAYLGIFSAIEIIFCYIESLFPLGIPGVKLGLANLVIVFLLYLYGVKEAVAVSFVRILVIGFLFGNLFSILFSLAGAVVSLGLMVILKKTKWFSVVGVSVAGGVSHNIAQIIVASFVVGNLNLFWYLPVLLVSGVIAGFLMDRWGIQITVLTMSVLIVLGMICLYLSEFNMNFAWGYCVFFGLTMSLPRMLPSLLTSTVFGTKDYAGIYAFLNLFFLIGAAGGSVLTSILQGILGYGITWMIYAGFAILLFCCVTVALSNGNKLRTVYPDGELA